MEVTPNNGTFPCMRATYPYTIKNQLWVPWADSLWHNRAGKTTLWKYFLTMKLFTCWRWAGWRFWPSVRRTGAPSRLARLASPLPVVSVRRVEEDTGEMCPDCGLPVLHLVWRLREVLTVLCLSTLRRDVPVVCWADYNISKYLVRKTLKYSLQDRSIVIPYFTWSANVFTHFEHEQF